MLSVPDWRRSAPGGLGSRTWKPDLEAGLGKERFGRRRPRLSDRARRRRQKSFTLGLKSENKKLFPTNSQSYPPPRVPLPARSFRFSRWLSLWPTAPWASRRRYGRALRIRRRCGRENQQGLHRRRFHRPLSLRPFFRLENKRENLTEDDNDDASSLRRSPFPCLSPAAFTSKTSRMFIRIRRSSKGDPERQGGAAARPHSTVRFFSKSSTLFAFAHLSFVGQCGASISFPSFFLPAALFQRRSCPLSGPFAFSLTNRNP